MTNKNDKTYERNGSHSHCWNQGKAPACGQSLENHKQCCLCDTRIPTDEVKESVNFMQVGEMSACGHCDERFIEGLKQAEEMGYFKNNKCKCKCHKKVDDKKIREEISKILIKWDMPTRQAAISDILLLLDSELERQREEMIDLFTKKTINAKGEPICPKCNKDMERDCQEPQGHLWFCPCSPSLRLSVG